MDLTGAMVRLRIIRSEKDDRERIQSLRKELSAKQIPAKPRPSWVCWLWEKWRMR